MTFFEFKYELLLVKLNGKEKAEMKNENAQNKEMK